jgi:EEF1A N-terminal glycine/lysine methyltransferase
MESVEDIFSGSLESLYDHAPVTYASAGSGSSEFVYRHPTRGTTLRLAPPDTTSANHALHASDIWVSSVFLADHIDELALDEIIEQRDSDQATRQPGLPHSEPLKILELGAGAGLPSILLATERADVCVVVSDYPDPTLIRALAGNVARNASVARGKCVAVPHAWGTSCVPLFAAGVTTNGHPASNSSYERFDIVLAADTLWNSATHEIQLITVTNALRRIAHARAYFVAGLHTGRWALGAFLRKAEEAGLILVNAEERSARLDERRRPWKVDRGSEDEAERRRWVVCFIFRWASL